MSSADARNASRYRTGGEAQAALPSQKRPSARSSVRPGRARGSRLLRLLHRYPRLGARLHAELWAAPRERFAPLPTLPGATQQVLRIGRRGLRVQLLGRGPLVVFVHGWQGGASQMRGLAQASQAAGYRAALFDMPAHGEAPGWSTNVLEFIEVLSGLSERLGPVHAFVGHGLGGMASLLCAARGLPVAGVVALAPLPSVEYALASYARGVGLSPEGRELLARRLEKISGVPRSDVDLSRVQPLVPTLLIHDRMDRSVPLRHSRRLRDGWHGARLLETSGLGHRRTLDEVKVAQEMITFLQSLPG